MLRRNGLAVAGTFFRKKESHKITYRSGRHQTELDANNMSQDVQEVEGQK